MSLSTHVLDTVHGTPASGIKVELWKIGSDNDSELITSFETNADGRADQPLLTNDKSNTGEYELVFHVADYFKSKGVDLPNPPFLNKVPIRFGIANPKEHYHVPLLVTPWAYNTYRGS